MVCTKSCQCYWTRQNCCSGEGIKWYIAVITNDQSTDEWRQRIFYSWVRQPAGGPVSVIPRAPIWLSTGLNTVYYSCVLFVLFWLQLTLCSGNVTDTVSIVDIDAILSVIVIIHGTHVNFYVAKRILQHGMLGSPQSTGLPSNTQ